MRAIINEIKVAVTMLILTDAMHIGLKMIKSMTGRSGRMA